MVLLTLVDFGIAVDRREVIQHAVREGARQGAVRNLSVADTKLEVVNQSQGVLEEPMITVCWVDGPDANTSVGDPGDYLRVSADYTYNFSVGAGEILSSFGITVPGIPMSPEAQSRLESTNAGAAAC
jgi:hypothetical protein